ncbi:MarR family winged helix-turn-helix transcriptional regulator [Ramlibacter sp. MAHUQ-53]|uniref:MarR family winged helix-turn-helix transcriptional regulator n=1 Tax=unclassified Ramlibacter TaxID=2617605 RepID=UPI00363AD6D4
MASRTPTFYRPGTYQPEDSAIWLMRRITIAFAREVGEQLEPDGLTHAQWIPLLKIHKGLATTAAELARETHVDAATITRTLDRLEDKGFLRRVRSSQDRRVVNLELTPRGEAVAGKIPALLCDVQNAQLRGFSRDELDTLKGLLRRVLANTPEGRADAAAQEGPDA